MASAVARPDPALPVAASGAGPPTVAVAFSGGRDSLALLHATVNAARPLGLQVVAIHVHHGLLPDADAWLAHARRLVARWRRAGAALSLRWARLDGQPVPGDSVEAWARAGRHAALDRLARGAGATLLLLGQHRRDQAETVLLQALRGGGPAGLAAMPRSVDRDGLIWARPWLDWPREAVDAYVQRHRLRPLEDPSNADLRLARNRLRARVWPALCAAFDGAETALATAARRAHQADAALAELATIDLAGLTDADGRLDAVRWQRLSDARRANALRAWWSQASGRSAPDSLVQRLIAELPPGARGALRWPAGAGLELVLYRGALSVAAARPTGPRQAAQQDAAPVALDLSRPGRIAVAGWAGCFEVSEGAGLASADLRLAELRPRCGGERFQRAPQTPPRSLKKQYQAMAVPAGERCGPLVWAGERLLYVPGLGIDARALAAPGMPQRVLCWRPDAAESKDLSALLQRSR